MRWSAESRGLSLSMAKIDKLIFGFRKIKISTDAVGEVGSLLLQKSIHSEVYSNGEIIVKENDYLKIREILSGRVEFESSEPLGLYGWWKRIRFKGVILITIAVSIFAVVWLSGLIWDIRIDGNVNINDRDVLSVLADCGLDIGNPWRKIDKSEIEVALLNERDDISWVNINQRGCVAYVKIVEKEDGEKTDEQSDPYTNIVASCDCVIEEITVKSGIAVVKEGDVVKKGDLLVIGAMPEEFGGALCKADARIIGRVNETVQVDIARKYDKITERNKKVYSISLKILKLSINIFKKYGILSNECDIIEENMLCLNLMGKKLPLSIHKKYLIEHRTEACFYTDEELINIAAEKLMSVTVLRLEDSDLVKIKTNGGFTDSGYTMKSDIVFLRDVCEQRKIDVENKETSSDRKNSNN